MMARLAFAAMTAALAACAPVTSSLTGAPTSPSDGVHRFVIQSGKKPVAWTQFVPVLSCGSGLPLTSVVVGPDKNMWFADPCGGLLKVTMAGVTQERLFKRFTPTQIAVGADGRFYMTQQGSPRIGVSGTQGYLRSYKIPSGDKVHDGGIALGPDGNVWFAEQFHVGKITQTGLITEYLYDPGQTRKNVDGGLTTGSDGDVWVTDEPEGLLLRVDPLSGGITRVGAGCAAAGPVIPVRTPSPWNVWFWGQCGQNAVSGVNESGQNVVYDVPWPIAGSLPQAMILGPGGDPWWASVDSAIVRLNVHTDTVTAFLPPHQTDTPDAIALGPDGNIWAATANGKIDVYILNVINVKPSSLTLTSIGQQETLTVTEGTRQRWSAKSSDTAVATVTPGSVGSQFVVTAVGNGTCTVTVRDAIENSFPVSATVTTPSLSER